MNERKVSFRLFLITLGWCILWGQSIWADEARYVYDDLGRLSAVIDSGGNAAVYTYDAVGNLLSITRSDVAPTGVSISFFTPKEGAIGTEVTLYGAGFRSNPVENEVKFNGVSAQVISSAATEIVAVVPNGAASGLISLENSNGSALTTDSFTVTSSITIEVTPEKATVFAGSSMQFTAMVTGSANQEVAWSFVGGGSVIGSLSDAGLYHLASSAAGTEPAVVTIRATSLADITQQATATVFAFPSGSFGPIIAPQISVAIIQPLPPTGPFVAPEVSIVIDEPPVSSGPFVAPQVSIGMDQAPAATGPFVGPQVSISMIPMIYSISPSIGLQGATNLQMTIAGKGLEEVTALSFLLNGADDTFVTASNIVSNIDGTQVTADLNIDSAAPEGLRIVRVITSNTNSLEFATEGNTFLVTAP